MSQRLFLRIGRVLRSCCSGSASNMQQLIDRLPPSVPASRILIGVVLGGVGALCAWLHKAIHPPPPKLCGSPGGPPVTAPRVRLQDGRHLAYKESGVPRNVARHKVIYVHAFARCRHNAPAFTEAFLKEHSISVVSFDRAGYGQSDPNPRRNIKSEALDIEQLADLLNLGDTFYLLTESMGGCFAWSCLKYIPNRLAGVGMIVPVVNFWWHGVNRTEFKKAFGTFRLGDRIFMRVVHYFPWLTYFWITQPWIPQPTPSTTLNIDPLNATDREVFQRMARTKVSEERLAELAEATQQGIGESLCRDARIMLSDWGFDPGSLGNPYPDNHRVHLWQGEEDYLVPVSLQRYIHRRLPWIQYHEMSGWGHLMSFHEGFPDLVLRTLILGEKFDQTALKPFKTQDPGANFVP